MSPGEGDADNGHGKNRRGDDVRQRQPPPRQQQPDQVADQAERPGTDIGLAGQSIAAHRPLTERH
jgi:hypothetical protein